MNGISNNMLYEESVYEPPERNEKHMMRNDERDVRGEMLPTCVELILPRREGKPKM